MENETKEILEKYTPEEKEEILESIKADKGKAIDLEIEKWAKTKTT